MSPQRLKTYMRLMAVPPNIDLYENFVSTTLRGQSWRWNTSLVCSPRLLVVSGRGSVSDLRLETGSLVCLVVCVCFCVWAVSKNWKSCLSCLSPGCLWARVPVWAASKNWKCESCGWLLSWWEKIDRIWWTWTGRRAKFSILFTEAHPLQLALWALHGKEDRYEKLAKSDPVSDLETNDIWLMNTESRKMDSGNLHYI